MKRRQLLAAASVVAMAPLPALAQRTARMPTIGLLWPGFAFGTTMQAFRDELKSRGHTDGTSFMIESRHLVQTADELDAAAAALVAKKVDIIFAVFPVAVRAARKATQTIPIVAVVSTDPVGDGFAQSLARPGGNVTGVRYFGLELQSKRLEILRDTFPALRRVLVLAPSLKLRTVAALRESAAQLNLSLDAMAVPTVADLNAQIQRVAESGAQAIVWIGGPSFGAHQRAVTETLGKIRIPAIYPQTGYVRNGGLISYASSQFENFRMAARHVDRILKGANPAELPFEQASKFEFVVNLQAAKAQGIRIPEAIVLRATEIIE